MFTANNFLRLGQNKTSLFRFLPLDGTACSVDICQVINHWFEKQVPRFSGYGDGFDKIAVESRGLLMGDHYHQCRKVGWKEGEGGPRHGGEDQTKYRKLSLLRLNFFQQSPRPNSSDQRFKYFVLP